MTITIYHNPSCSKSRQALELIQEHGHEPKIILYLQNPPTAAELTRVLAQLSISPTELIRFKEDKAKELGLHVIDKRSEKEWINIIAANPEIIERPIVVRGNKALVCRPAEKVLDLL